MELLLDRFEAVDRAAAFLGRVSDGVTARQRMSKATKPVSRP